MRFFIRQGDDVSVISSIACDRVDGAKVYVLPTLIRASDALVKRSDKELKNVGLTRLRQKIMRSGWESRLYFAWSMLKTVNVLPQAIVARRILRALKPDVVVAFRIQNEGYIAAVAGFHPMILFTQGSDFTYMAGRRRLHAWLTRFTVRRADALMSDCHRDIRMAGTYGLEYRTPTQLLPGNGGIDFSVYRLGIPAAKRERMVVYVRGLVPYVRLDSLLKSIHNLQRKPDYADVRYKLIGTPAVIPAMECMARQETIDMSKVDILPFMSQGELVSLLQEAAILVSPSITDGTPNSMLEAMACGSFPVMSDLESIREWICHGQNGLLFDPAQPQELIHCLETALDDASLRQQAQEKNIEMVRKSADYWRVMPEVRRFIANVSVVQQD